jgi:hypothetical protein
VKSKSKAAATTATCTRKRWLMTTTEVGDFLSTIRIAVCSFIYLLTALTKIFSISFTGRIQTPAAARWATVARVCTLLWHVASQREDGAGPEQQRKCYKYRNYNQNTVV